MKARGDYIGGAFHAPSGEPFASHDPATSAVVLETAGSSARAAEAAAAAHAAAAGWAARSFDERVQALARFRDALGAREAPLAEAIRLEMGKIESEAVLEAKSLVSRFALVEAQLRADLADREVAPGEHLLYRPHGVVAILGPFNFPLHLCHAHVVPALMLGNAVVVKPSELCPLAGERYAEAADAAGLPPGLINVVQGGGAIGATLVSDPHVRGLAFTGSWPVGRRITEAALDRPELLLALEMGGKNACVVRHDAELRQAIHEIAVSGYLTTGQRCTCADRVLVHRSVADALTEGLAKVARALRFDDPRDARSFAGPLVSRRAKERYSTSLEAARGHAAVEVIVTGRADREHAYVDASLHRLAPGVHVVGGYTDTELFGPDLVIETFEDDAEAIAALNASPYGFAHAVFTADDAAFGQYRREVDVGILNLRRGTNQASPKLPFGGLKRSGNFRPAGAWAGRNLVSPLAEIRAVDGVFASRAVIAAELPPPDLFRLELRHQEEETLEAARTLLDAPRPMKPRLPKGGRLPESEALLDRYHAGDRYVRGEKKPPVFDHLRSRGGWMVSVDKTPLSVLDGMSQTATLPDGFAPDHVVKAYVDGVLSEASLSSADTALGDDPHALAFAETLRALVPGLPTVSFVNSGAEANEKAYALCRANAKEGADRLLALEGSFHGRTLLALYASHNPSKRVPFEIAGYEVAFAKCPVSPKPANPPDPDGWVATWGAGDIESARARFTGDAQLVFEVEALVDIASKMDGRFAVVVEPMQSEGGDRYLTPRFHRALRLLTRARGVALIMDEVQCGFGLSGPFAWHKTFRLVDKDGRPDTPDCVCFAKRAQAGVCMSRWPDPEPTSAFPASLARGRLHALNVGEGKEASRVEALVRPRLETLAARWPHLVENPRATGYAIAFELPTVDDLNRYLGQRFWRGVVVFGAGTRTVRYRLSSAWNARTVELLFTSMQRSLAWLEAHPGKKPPEWEDFEAPPAKKPSEGALKVRVATPDEADAIMPRILELEARVYEPARRDTEEHLRKCLRPDGVAILAEIDGALVGSALGTPLEEVSDLPGPDRDPMLGRDNTMYSLAITVDPAFHGHGVGRALKRAQLERARAMTRADGARRYLHATGRNRVPEAQSMSRLADSLGAYTVVRLEKQYGGDGVARYYRQPLGAFTPGPVRTPAPRPRVDLASGLSRPFSRPPASLEKLHAEGGLFGPSVTKITLLNYLTPAAVRATEWVGALTPSLPHTYMCSSRDETVDKSVRALRWHRPKAQHVVSFEGEYVGHTSAGARSISDPSTHRQGAPYFAWPRLPHPADDLAASLAALRALVADGPDKIFGIYISPVQERTGRVVPEAFWSALATLRGETGVPVVVVETPCAYYRSGLGAFATSRLPFEPDLMIWWTGGQLGFVHTSARYHVAAPLTLVSTWDGDELSLIQAHHQLRAARAIDIAAASQALDEALAPVTSRGLGLLRVIDAGEGATSLADALLARGIRVRAYPGGRLGVIPALDTAIEDAAALGEALRALV